jgi:hypothetical protein
VWLIPAINLSLVLLTPLNNITGDNDTGDKSISGINDTAAEQ